MDENQKKAASVIIVNLSENVDFIDFAIQLRDNLIIYDEITELSIVPDRDGTAARISWLTTYADRDASRRNVKLMASAAGAVISSDFIYKDMF